MGINDLHPDLPGMGGNPLFPPNQQRRGGPGSGFGGGFGGGPNLNFM